MKFLPVPKVSEVDIWLEKYLLLILDLEPLCQQLTRSDIFVYREAFTFSEGSFLLLGELKTNGIH